MMCRNKFVLLLTLCLIPVTTMAQAQEPAKKKATDYKTAVASYTAYTSFFDSGLKMLVLGDGTVYAFTGSFPGSATGIKSVSRFQLTNQEKEHLIDIFDRNDFFDLPKEIRENVADGTSETLILATPKKSYQSYRYMKRHDGFTNIVNEFRRLWDDHKKDRKSVKLADTVTDLETRLKNLPKKSRQQVMVTEWKDRLNKSYRAPMSKEDKKRLEEKKGRKRPVAKKNAESK